MPETFQSTPNVDSASSTLSQELERSEDRVRLYREYVDRLDTQMSEFGPDLFAVSLKLIYSVRASLSTRRADAIRRQRIVGE